MSVRDSLAVLLLLLAAPQVRADAEETTPWDRVAWKIFLENDSVGAGSDRNYTQGVQVQAWFWEPDFRRAPDRHVDRAIDRWCDRRETADGSDCSADVGFGFGQTIYTPRSIEIAEPQPDEHPWGGYLFVSGSLALSTTKRQHMFETQVGIIGPSAQAQWVQSEWHSIIGAPRPLGWSNQIKNEAAVEWLYTYRSKFDVDKHVDAVVELGGGVGTVRDFVSAGVSVRAGKGLIGFGKRQIRALGRSPDTQAGSSGMVPFTGGQREYKPPDLREREGPYAFISTSGRWIPFDTFLRGGTFHRVPTDIDAHDFTWDGSAGFVFSIPKLNRTTVAIEEVWRSPEFDGQWQRFLSVVVTFQPGAD